MAIQIQILSTQVKTVPTAKNSYQQMEVAYKNLTFQGKVEGRKVMSFGASAETFKVLAAAQPNDVFEIEVVKNDKGFNDWVSAKKGAAGASVSTAPAGTLPASGAAATASPRSTYETPEERAKKQIYIVRQSSISSAIELLSVGAKTSPGVTDVLSVAKQLEAFVFGDEVPESSSEPAKKAKPAKTDVSTSFDDLDDLPH